MAREVCQFARSAASVSRVRKCLGEVVGREELRSLGEKPTLEICRGFVLNLASESEL